MSPLISSLRQSFAVGTTFPKIVTNGLVLHLDAGLQNSYSGSGNIWRDLSGNNANGTLVGGVRYDPNNGGSFIFDGGNDYITLGNIYRYQGNLSIEAIARFPSLPNNGSGPCSSRHPIVYNHDYGYNLLASSTAVFQIYNSSSSAAAAVSINSVIGQNYFHIMGIKNGVNVSLYVNGLFQSSSNLSSNVIYYINEPFTIGGYAACANSRFYSTGNIAKVSLYNRALTAEEIAQNFNAVRGRFGI